MTDTKAVTEATFSAQRQAWEHCCLAMYCNGAIDWDQAQQAMAANPYSLNNRLVGAAS